MSFPDLIITRLVEEPRDRAVSAILRAMAQAIDAGAEIEPEPERRDTTHRVVRTGPLDLPRRADFSICKSSRTLFCRVESEVASEGGAVTARVGETFTVEIGAFAWDAAEITIHAKAEPDWNPVRLWFLEWFQSRHSDVSPELFGAVHSLDGPEPLPGGWGLTIDFGSAPAAVVPEFILALAETGAEGATIGHR